ncbi:MAG: efflux RND transporter periplasmic adaptor subunit [Betaproteobacteria bacterium]|nr:MAG: efflux RND transporter periplasmic adaptor subunit [Betaproteobacteria bacterium]
MLPFSKPHSKFRRVLTLALVVVFVLTAAAGLALWMDRKKATAAQTEGHKRAERPQPVQVMTVRQADMAVWLDAMGTVTPQRVVTVRTRVDGVLHTVLFREGETVKQGQVLAEIDPQVWQIQLAQAQGQLARDQAVLDNAQRDLLRQQTLLSRGMVTQQALDTHAAQVAQHQGALAVDRAQVEQARLQLSYTRIKAPLTGQIGLRQVDVGNLIKTNDAQGIAVITQMQPASVVFALPERHLTTLRARHARQPLRVEAWDAGQHERVGLGQVQALDNQIDTATGTLRLKAEFANREGRLFANQFVNVRLLLETRPQVMQVATAAVQRGAKGAFVYRVGADGRVAVVAIAPDWTDDGWTALAQGDTLAVGDRVVIDGADRLREGAKVRVIEAKEQSEKAQDTKGQGEKAAR